MKLQIKVIPSSSRDAFAGWLGETLKIKVKAPPEKGRANKAVIKFLEKALQLPKGSISIASGLTASRKTLEIDTHNSVELNEKLRDLTAEG
ncbi:MAG TPA: DUF167 domain-containing protein [Gammaproteobacteria bacterium]|nr:DUF167 domain-containing protein [Gammaproteobacteria bacterium]